MLCLVKELSYFHPAPRSVLPGNDVMSLKFVTPNHCARLCIDEEGFVCRSFDYEVRRLALASEVNKMKRGRVIRLPEGRRRRVSSERQNRK